MHQSVEVRLPHQAPEMVEFLISVPARFRFTGWNSGKLLMREVVRRRLGEQVSGRSKYGFAVPLWNNPTVAREMKFKEKLCDSTFLRDFPFRKKAEKVVLNNIKLLPRMAALAGTYEHCKAIMGASR